jgi:deazaflavin-dependent oxidoreductase (nitroreductase family)
MTSGPDRRYRGPVTLAGELGYGYPRPNVLQRGVQALASTRPGAWCFSKTLAPMDRAMTKITRGRTSVPAVLAGLPVLVLTSVGHKSGRPRRSYLIAVPFEDRLALLGTNFGQPRTPAWVFNLEAQPRAAVSFHDVTRDVIARPATDPERAAVLARSTSVYGGYVKYEKRITGRQLRIFIIETG